MHGASSATVDVADEPRWCHFAIEAANVEWQMTLEQGYASDSRYREERSGTWRPGG